MIDFLANKAFNKAPRTCQKSIQEASKTDEKGYRKYDASWLGIWSPLGTDLGGFWVQVGRQVGAKLAPKSQNLEIQEHIKNSYITRDATHLGEPGRTLLLVP